MRDVVIYLFIYLFITHCSKSLSGNMSVQLLLNKDNVQQLGINYYTRNVATRRLGSSVGIVTELRAGRPGDRIPVGGETFRTRPDRP